MGRILGLDIGNVRIGIAISDALFITAQGIDTYERKGEKEDIDYFKKLVEENNIQSIVCGLPKNMDGSMGEQAKKATEFGDLLNNQIGVPIIYWDERLTTKLAQRTLLEADVSRKKRKKVVDKIAAVYILQSYLESMRSK